MESIAAPLRRLHEEGTWFARAGEIKLLYVRADSALREAAVELLSKLEHHADNRALFFRFDDSFTEADRGWPDRVQRLQDQFAEKIDSVAPADIHLRPLGRPPGAPDGAIGFGLWLMEIPAALAAPLTGAVVVLAPSRVAPEQELFFREEVTALVTSPRLPHVRWIVVETDGGALSPLAGRLGPAALTCLSIVDEKQQQDDLAAAAGAPPAADPIPASPPASSWRAPGAMPEVVPPPRRDLPMLPSDEALRAAGLSPKFIKGGGDVLKRLVLGGALAMRRGKHADAITLQARAAELCAEMEMPREQIVNLHVLGGYVIAAGQRAKAREVYVRAGELSSRGEHHDLASQSELALGMMDTIDKRPAEAAAHYSSAGRLAEKAKIEALAIECWRMAGQLAVVARLEGAAVECWKRALELIEPLEPEIRKLTGAPEVARALAALFRKRGMVAQADSLERRSVEIEAGIESEVETSAAS